MLRESYSEEIECYSEESDIVERVLRESVCVLKREIYKTNSGVRESVGL